MIRTILCSLFVMLAIQVNAAAQQTLISDTSHTLFSWDGNAVPFQLGTITTDRPDFTEAASTVGFGVVQLEAGYTFTKNGSAENHQWGEPLTRVGMLTNWFEFRFQGFPQSQRDASGNVSTTYEDYYLGAKIGLTPQDGWLPEMAIIPQANVNVDDFSVGNVLLGVNWIYSWDLTETTSIAGSTQVNRIEDDTVGELSEWAQSIAFGQSLTEEIGFYVEWFGLFPTNSSLQNAHSVNGGFTFLLTENVQFDIRGGLGLNDAADDYFIGTGFSVRWP